MTTQTETVNYTELCNAVEHALANFTGSDEPIDGDIVDLVAMRIHEHWDKRGSYSFDQILESTSTYVQCDLSHEELADYAGELEEQLEAYGLL
jgi:hypothetical protein